jgi:ATP-binding cassette subfamily B multidrug efflux pump
VNSGETVALVGSAGSAKSSSMALIHRVYGVQQGMVRVGGHHKRDVIQVSLSRHIEMVLKDPDLFSGSVCDGIRDVSHWASDDNVNYAARTVGAHDFIAALPQGYDTVLDERGGNLSLGQRQLHIFVRALDSSP